MTLESVGFVTKISKMIKYMSGSPSHLITLVSFCPTWDGSGLKSHPFKEQLLNSHHSLENVKKRERFSLQESQSIRLVQK